MDYNFASKFANDVSAVGAHNVDHHNVDWSGSMGADLNDFSQEVYACKEKIIVSCLLGLGFEDI